MTILHAPAGLLDAKRVILADTSDTDVLAVTSRTAVALIRVANTSGSAVTVDIEVFDGATSFYIAKGHSIAANTEVEWRDEMLSKGDTLKAKAGTGSSALHVHVLYSMSDPAAQR